MSVTFWLILLFSLCLILALAEKPSITRKTEHDLIAIDDDSSVENNIVHGNKHGSDKHAPLYHHVGCFLDNSIRRAVPFSGLSFRSPSPAKRINQCALLAFNGGYDTFGVQLGGECFTGPSARHTYGIYGPVSGCINGLGGIWRNDIYFLDIRKGIQKRTLSTEKKRSRLRNAKWCCGNTTYNPWIEQCCLNGQVVRQNFSCTPCNKTFYDENKLICCNGAYLLPRKYGFKTSCCENLVYNRNIKGCCGLKLYKKSTHKCCVGCCGRKKIILRSRACNRCGGRKYNPNRFICCSGKLLPKCHGAFTRCCGQRAYNASSSLCCRYNQTGKILPRRHGAFTRCCGQRAYNALYFLCCRYNHAEKVQRRKAGFQKTKCCRTGAYNIMTQKCCGNGLVLFKRFTCSKCAGKHYNPAKRICCGRGRDQVLKSKTFGLKTRCCQSKIYNLRSQKCCNEKIHGTARHGRSHARCCGSRIYDRRKFKCCRNRWIFPKAYSCVPCALKNYYDPGKKICCRGILFKRKYGSSSSCCSKKLYDNGRWKCCNGLRLVPKKNSCSLPWCGKRRYNETTQICCDGHAILPRIFGPKTGCCLHNRTRAVYHVQRQKCCFGKPIANIETCFPDGINCTTDMDVSRHICCGNMKRVKSFGENSDCCGDIVYDRVHEICCDGIPSPVNSGGRYECCGTSSYNAKVAKCCIGNKVVPNCGRCPTPK